MKRLTRATGVVAVAALLTCLLAPAIPTLAQTARETPTSADSDAWRFRATAYGWAMSVSGTLTARGQVVDVDQNFIQLLQTSKSLIGYMGYFEANKGPVGFYADVVWAKLGFAASSASTRNPVEGLKLSTTTSTALTYSLTVVDVGGLYEFVRWPGAAGSFTALDGVLGFRYWNNAVDANFDILGTASLSNLGLERSRSIAIARSGSLDWVDPVVGLRLRHQFAPRQEIMVWGDVGGFGLQSNFGWQALGVYSYAWQFTGYQLAALIGYRALGVNYSNPGNSNSVNLVLHGPMIGFSMRF